MQERDVLDLLLVVVLAVAAYVESFGLASPIATLGEMVDILTSFGVGVYLVFAGIFGIIFLGYLTVYLPKKDAARAANQR